METRQGCYRFVLTGIHQILADWSVAHLLEHKHQNHLFAQQQDVCFSAMFSDRSRLTLYLSSKASLPVIIFDITHAHCYLSANR